MAVYSRGLLVSGVTTVARERKPELDNRLRAYFATLRSSRLTGNWQIYAAVTGSVMAMTTNASAQVIYSGIEDVIAGPVASHTFKTNFVHSVKILNLNGMPDLQLSVFQGHLAGSTNWHGGVKLKSETGPVNFLHTNGGSFVKKLASGAAISSKAGGVWATKGRIASQQFSLKNAGTEFYAGNEKVAGGWPAGSIGFAGFSFKTVPGDRFSDTDYGWVRLEYLTGQNGAADEVEAIDWAYAANGGTITAGEGASPEPSTGALALLAAGAAGVAFLRRRKRAAA